MKKESILAFSDTTTILAVSLFGGILFFLAISMISTKLTIEFRIYLVVFIVILASTILVFSFRKASIAINSKFVRYSSGFITKELEVDSILSASIIKKEELPSMSYKLWAYAAFSEINGLVKLEDGRRLYIAGNSTQYLYLTSKDFDMIFAVGKNALSQDMVDTIIQEAKKMERIDSFYTE